MTAGQIPVIEASGTHRQVGQQIGEQLKDQIRETLHNQRRAVPIGVSWDDLLRNSQSYLAASKDVFPQYLQELEGVAEGSGSSFDELFLSMCEELFEAGTRPDLAPGIKKGCTDMVARGNATLDGSTLVAHTNDLLPEAEKNLAILDVAVENEPQFLGVSSGGVAISAGFNAAGISLTGNQVDANDTRPGVPRLLMVRACLAARRLGEAMDICLLPQRASNYNNVIADSNGEVYSMEGSATDCEPLYIDDDLLAHTNHYISYPMRRFEADRSEIGGSIIRYNRAMRLLRQNYGQLTPELFQKLLADHANYPTSICKHGLETVTVFSMVINTTTLHTWIGPGRACQTKYTEYQLDPYKNSQDG